MHPTTANRLDSMFNRVFGEDGRLPSAWSGPSMAAWQDEDNIYVELELPGVLEGDVDLTVHDGILAIRAERKAAEGRRYLVNTQNFGRIERFVRLPGPVMSEQVQADLANGILLVTLPKTPEAKPRKIAVRSAAQA